MLTEERYAGILAMLDEEGSVTVSQLMKAFDASESTIRRDLNSMDASGLLTKVHGGAIARNYIFSTEDENVTNRKFLHAEEKVRIAKYAASLIEPDDFVYMDAGTTTEMMIDYISSKQTTFVTNAITHALKLSERGFTVFILGGEIKSSTQAAVGAETEDMLEMFNFTKGFFGVNGIDPEKGFSTPEVNEALVKKKAMSNCKERYILADESKFSQISSVKFADFDRAVVITTNLNQKKFKKYKNIKEV